MGISEEQALFRQAMAQVKGMVTLNNRAAPSEYRRANAPTTAHYPKNAALASAKNAAQNVTQNATSEVQNRRHREQARPHVVHSIEDAARAKQPLQRPSSRPSLRASMPAMRQTASELMARPVACDARLAHGNMSKKHTRALKNSAIAQRWTLDLHGATKSEATTQLSVFLHEAHAAGAATVCVIHGKGTGTLKGHVSHLLRQTPCVRAYCSAASNQGGTGALMVALKTTPARKT